MRSRALFWAVFAFALAADQASKAWIRGALSEHQAPGFPWPGVFELTLKYNEGIAFGMLQGYGALLSPVAVAIGLGAWIYSHRHPEEGSWTHVAMALLSGGAFGNLLDRMFLGKVTDMFWIRLVEFPVFNVADSCITVAAAILVLKWGFELAPHKRPAEAHEVPADAGPLPTPPIETVSREGQ